MRQLKRSIAHGFFKKRNVLLLFFGPEVSLEGPESKRKRYLVEG